MLNNTFLYRLVSILRHQKKVDAAIREYRPGLTGSEFKTVKRGVIWAYAYDFWLPREYFLYGYDKMSQKARHEFVSTVEWQIFLKTTYSDSILKMLEDKWSAYQYFSEFYNRKMFRSYPLSQKPLAEQYASFLQLFTSEGGLVSKAVIKPLDSCCGQGVKVIECDCYSDLDSFGALFDAYPGGAIIEEQIVQHPELAQFHPSSVNTIRVNTVRFANEVYPFLPFFRIGKGNLIVDNLNGGGIESNVDIKTGRLFVAEAKDFTQYKYHPDTDVKIEGFEIPQWNELMDVVRRAGMKLDVGAVVGWDFALTPKGWSLVEINKCPGIFFIQREFRKEFEYIKARHKQETRS